jgi:hypothetical protein
MPSPAGDVEEENDDGGDEAPIAQSQKKMNAKTFKLQNKTTILLL